MENKFSHLEKFNPDELLITSFRYFLGRKTIATCAFTETLAESWEEIPENTRRILQRDLEEAFERDDDARERCAKYFPLGMNCDRRAWEKVREKYQNGN